MYHICILYVSYKYVSYLYDLEDNLWFFYLVPTDTKHLLDT